MFTQTETRTNTQSEENSLTFSTPFQTQNRRITPYRCCSGRGMNGPIFRPTVESHRAYTTKRNKLLEMVPLSHTRSLQPVEDQICL